MLYKKKLKPTLETFMFTANRKWQISNPILKKYVVNNCWLLKIGANCGINLMNQLVTLFSKSCTSYLQIWFEIWRLPMVSGLP